MTTEEAKLLYEAMENHYGELPSYLHEPQQFENLFRMFIYRNERTLKQNNEVVDI